MIDKAKNFLKSKSGKIMAYAMIEKIIDICVSLLTGIMVVRLLQIDDYGIIATISGYATFINIINIAPINYLYKEYGRSLKYKLNETISSYVVFERYKAIIILAAYVTIGIYLSIIKENTGFIIIGVSSSLNTCIEIFVNINRSVLELNYQQKKITKVIFLCRIIKLAICSALFFWPSIWVIFARDIGIAILEYTALRRLTKNNYNIIKIPMRNIVQQIRDAFSGFCLSNHFSGVLTNIIYGSDTMFLSMFWSQAIVGQYGITLTCLNYFNPFFQVLQKNTMIELGASENLRNDMIVVEKYSKLSCMLSLVCIIGYLAFGKIMFYVFTGDWSLSGLIYHYGIYIFAGVCLYNCVRPLTAFLCLRGNINKYLVETIIPSAVFSVVMYYLSARFLGALMLAIANVVSYSFWVMLVILYYIRNKQCIIERNINQKETIDG